MTRGLPGIIPAVRRRWLHALACGLGLASTAAGQVVLDGSVGPAGPRQGPNFVIPHTVGRIQGGNLLHSFSRFNINAGESATFTGPTNATLSHVIARVTGREASNVNGVLRSAIPGADFYLINPRGIVFGPEAQLDVQGSFVATTANFVRLDDGTRIGTRAAPAPVLTSAAPAAFGFLGRRSVRTGGDMPAAGEIRYTGGANQAAGLTVPQGKSLALIGGPVRIEGSRLQAIGGRVSVVAAAGGEVQLREVQGANAVGALRIADFGLRIEDEAGHSGVLTSGARFSPKFATRDFIVKVNPQSQFNPQSEIRNPQSQSRVNPQSSSNEQSSARADISLLDNANLRGPVGGSVLVRGRNVTVERAAVNADTDAIASGGVDLDATGRLWILNSGISTVTFGQADGGLIRLGGGDIVVRGLSTEGAGPVSANTEGAGRGGDVRIEGRSLALFADASITAFTETTANGGDISVDVRRAFRIDGAGSQVLTGLAAETLLFQGGGAGGDIDIRAGRVALANEAEITSTTKGSGSAGNITIRADVISIDGQDSRNPNDPSRTLTGVQARVGTGLDQLGASGAGGLIDVRAGVIRLIDGGVMTATTFGAGAGGSVDLRTDLLNIRGSDAAEFTGLFARSAFTGLAAGDGGEVRVRADDVSIIGAGDATASTTGISASSLGAGDAGGVTLGVGDSLVVRRGATLSTAASVARGGNVVAIAGNTLEVANATVTASSAQDGGSILLFAPGLTLRRSRVETSAVNADGGNIVIATPFVQSPDMIGRDALSGRDAPGRNSSPSRGTPGERRGGGFPASEYAVLAAAGNVFNPQSEIRTPQSLRQSTRNPQSAAPLGAPATAGSPTGKPSAAAVTGSTINANGGVNGGNISIQPTAVFISSTAVTATGATGVSGTITQTPVETELAGSIVDIAAALVDAGPRLEPVCALRVGGAISSFVVTSRGGAPTTPGGLEPGLWLVEPETPKPDD